MKGSKGLQRISGTAVFMLAVLMLAMIGMAVTLTLRPDSAGTYQAWGTFGSGTAHWDRTSDQSNATGVSITADIASKETMNLQNTSQTGTIDSITAYMRCVVTGGGGGTEKAVIVWRTYNTDYESAAATISRTTFTDYSETRATNPNTTAAWTWAEVNNLQVGARASTLGSGETVNCSEFWISTDYTPPNQAPQVSLNSPANSTQFNNTQNINFNFTATDDANTTLSCGIYLDSILNQTNSSTQNNTLANFLITGISYGSHNWYVNCTDGSASNVSETRVFTTTDTIPPAGVTNLNESATGQSWIYWNWTTPADADFNHTEVWINSTFYATVSKPTNYYNATGLTANITYAIQTRTVDSNGNINTTWVNDTATTQATDTTPPATVTNLNESATGTTWIYWTWTNPSDSDFNHTEIWINGTFYANVSKPTNYYNATGLSANTTYQIQTRTVDNTGNINTTWVNDTATTQAVPDTTPPAGVTNLNEIATGQTWIYWNWTNPADADFNHTEVWLNGTFRANVSVNYYNATGLNSSTTYQIQTRTADHTGNINSTWVNDTATTQAPPPDTTPPIISAVNASAINTTANITWTTDEAANSTVNYGNTTALGTLQSNSTSATSHLIALTSLTSAMTYYYNVTSCDASSNCNTTGPYNFTTDANVQIAVADANNSSANVTLQIYDETDVLEGSGSSSWSGHLKLGKKKIRTVHNSGPVKEINFTNVSISNNSSLNIGYDDTPEFGNYLSVYAIDPTALNFTSATVTVTATGSELYKCKNWNFAARSCADGNWTRVAGITPGENYTLTLTPEDPGYAEGTTANLSTLDDTDNLTKGIGEQINFYANYTNRSSGAAINGTSVWCEIKFNLTGNWTSTVNMSWNSSSLRYEYNRSFSSVGTYAWNVLCNGSALGYDVLNATDNVTITFSPITSCTNIASPGTYYLQNNVNSSGTCFNILANNVTLDCAGFSITGDNSTATYGIYSDQFNTTIRNCNISNFATGIYFYTADNGTIDNTTASTTQAASGNNGYGIYLYLGANYNRIMNSNANASAGYGIFLSGSTNNNITNTTATATNSYAIRLSSNSNYNTISNSTATAYTSAIYFQSSSNYNTISNSTVTATNYAIYLASNYNTISNVNANATNYAIYLDYSSNNTIANMTAITTNNAISLTSSSNNTISNSQINGKDNTYGALKVYSSSKNNTLANSTINGRAGTYAVTLKSGNNTGNRFINNTILNATNLLYLDANASTNTFYWNNFTDTSGLYVSDTSGNNIWNGSAYGINEGNIWYNVLNGSVQIYGTTNSTGFPSLRVGNAGSGYPYNSSNSLNKLIGAVDYAPLTTPDTTPPSVSIQYPTNGLNLSTNVSIALNFTASDAGSGINTSSCTYSLDGGSAQAIASCANTTFNVSSNVDGNHNISVSLSDNVGNPSTSSLINFTIDTTLPATITNLANQSQTTSSIYWNWTNPSDSDFSHTEVWLDGVWKANVSTPANYYNATSLVPGTSYEIQTRTVDNAGNINTTWVNDTATTLIDTQAPTYSNINEPADPSTYATPATYNFNITWTDDAAVSSVWLEFAGTNYTVSNASNVYYKNFYNLSASVYTYRWYANDTSGNLNYTATQTFAIDKVATTLTLNATPSFNVTYGTATNVSCAASNAEVSAQLYRNGAPVSNPDVQTLAASTYNYTCNNTATQNYTNASSSVALTVNKAIPVINLTLNGADSDISAGAFTIVNISAALITPAGVGVVELFEDGVFVTSTASSVTLQRNYTSLGTVNWTVQYNATQNYTSETKSHLLTIVDQNVPQFSTLIETPTDPATYSPTQTYQFNITWTDDIGISNVILEFAGANYSWLGGQLNKSGNVYSRSFGAMAAGTYNYKWYANDTSGNNASTSVQSYTIDKAVTALFLTFSPSNSVAYGTNTSAGCSANNPESVAALTRDGSGVSNPDVQTLAAGAYNYACTSPATQNWTSGSQSGTLTVNKAATTLTLSAQPAWTVLNGTQTNVSCSADNSEVIVGLYRNGTNVSAPDVANLSSGAYNYTCNASTSQNYTSASQSNLLKVIQIDANTFSGTTTNWSAQNLSAIPNVTLERSDNGKIVFTGNTSVTSDLDFDSYVNISSNYISLNSTALPDFDRAATLYMYSLAFTNPKIMKDGAECATCTKLSYTGGTLTFTVTGFSAYWAAEGLYCGDGTCNNGETCSSCSDDCGACSEDEDGGHGGGGGWIGNCTENWYCSDWAACSNGVQNRTCSERNKCGTAKNRPNLTQPCKACGEAWVCSEWSECKDGIQTRYCIDQNECGGNRDKPREIQSCEEKPKENEIIIPKLVEVQRAPNPELIALTIAMLFGLVGVLGLRSSQISSTMKRVLELAHIVLVLSIAGLLLMTFAEQPTTALASTVGQVVAGNWSIAATLLGIVGVVGAELALRGFKLPKFRLPKKKLAKPHKLKHVEESEKWKQHQKHLELSERMHAFENALDTRLEHYRHSLESLHRSAQHILKKHKKLKHENAKLRSKGSAGTDLPTHAAHSIQLPKARLAMPKIEVRVPRLTLPRVSLPKLSMRGKRVFASTREVLKWLKPFGISKNRCFPKTLLHAVPKFTLPKFNVPKLSLPKLAVPKLTMPTLSIPKLSIPRIKLPSIKINVPKLAFPRLNIPKISIPKIPKIHISSRKIERAPETIQGEASASPVWAKSRFRPILPQSSVQHFRTENDVSQILDLSVTEMKITKQSAAIDKRKRAAIARMRAQFGLPARIPSHRHKPVSGFGRRQL